MNVNESYDVSPEFEVPDNNLGFPIVDAVGILDVSAVNFSRMFYFKTNDLETIQNSSIGITNTSYGVIGDDGDGVNPFDINYPFSDARIRAGYANPALSFADNTVLYQDYVRYTAKSITGGYALSDIFSNEQDLLEGVRDLDISFNTQFRTLLKNASKCEANNVSIDQHETNTSVPFYNFVISSKSLVDHLLQDATSQDLNNTSSFSRGKRFLQDLADQSQAHEIVNSLNTSNSSNLALDGTGTELEDQILSVNFSGINTKKYWIIFHPGDVMAVRLNYQPKNGSGNNASNTLGTLGGNPINDRSYKIYLKMN